MPNPSIRDKIADSRICPSCKVSKLLSDYQIDRGRVDGRCLYCRECNNARRRASYAKNSRKDYNREYHSKPDVKERNRLRAKRMREKYPDKLLCRNKVNWAIGTGKLQRQECEICYKPNAQAHHKDYSKPFEITWLCSACHGKEHKKYV